MITVKSIFDDKILKENLLSQSKVRNVSYKEFTYTSLKKQGNF